MDRQDFYVLLGIISFITLMYSWEVSRYKVEIEPTNPVSVKRELAYTKSKLAHAENELKQVRGIMAELIEHIRHDIQAENPRCIEPDKAKRP